MEHPNFQFHCGEPRADAGRPAEGFASAGCGYCYGRLTSQEVVASNGDQDT